MQYLLAIYEPAGPAPPAEVLDPIMERVAAWQHDLEQRGSWVFTARLRHPLTSTVVRTRGDETLITDGPFSEGKEQLGGLSVIRARDLDEALDWAARFTAITGLAAEVRPLLDEG